MPKYLITDIASPLGHPDGLEPKPPDPSGNWQPILMSGDASCLFILWREVTVVSQNSVFDVVKTSSGNPARDWICKQCGERYGRHCGQFCPGENPLDPSAKKFQA